MRIDHPNVRGSIFYQLFGLGPDVCYFVVIRDDFNPQERRLLRIALLRSRQTVNANVRKWVPFLPHSYAQFSANDNIPLLIMANDIR